MLLLALLPPILGFLAAGCIAFYICAAIPALQRFALGTSLWLASFAVLVPAAFLPNIALIGLLSERHINEHLPLNAIAVHHVQALFLLNVLLLICIATAITLIHGILVRRTTFLLFRLYSTAVTICVAITLAWITLIVVGIISSSSLLGGMAALVVLALTTFSVYTYRNPNRFRAARPTRLQPISSTEYDALPHSAPHANT